MRLRLRNCCLEKIGTIIYRWLIFLVIIAFIIAAFVGLSVQNYFQKRQSFPLLQEYIDDFDAGFDFNAEMKDYITTGWGLDIDGDWGGYQDSDFLKRLVNSNSKWISEFAFVNGKGIVTASSNPEMIGVDLHSDDYLSEFLCILDGKDYFAKSFYPSPFESDKDQKTVYGGVPVDDHNGMVLFGFNEEVLKNQLEGELWEDVIGNRIGRTGYMIVCNEDKIMTGITRIAQDDKLQEKAPYAGEAALPETEDEISESITKFYGKECYVSAIKRADYYLIAAYPVADADALRKKYNYLFVVISLVIFASLFVVLYILINNHIVSEIGSIHGSLKKIIDGDLDEKASADGSLEFFDLSSDINDTVSNLKDRIRSAKEQMAAEMENARRIQESAVPKVFPENNAFELYASMNTAEAVGGDFYDFFMTDADTLVIVMADVSGKGMPAALYMMRAKTLIRTYAEKGLPVDEVAQRTNAELCEDASRDMFVTAWLGFLDLGTGVLSYVHAGHTLPVFVGREISFVKQKVNMVLGGLKKARYIRQEITLFPGESLFLYTDGVTEAHNTTGEMYGEDRLISLIREKRDENTSCKTGCEMVYDSVVEFTGVAPQYDDITMMWLTYRGKNE